MKLRIDQKGKGEVEHKEVEVPEEEEVKVATKIVLKELKRSIP